MGKSQSKELDDIILNIYAVLVKPNNEFDVEDVLKYTRQLSKFKGKQMKCIYLDEKYLNEKNLNGFLDLFYKSVVINDEIDEKSKNKFDKTFPDLEVRKKACFIYFIESVEYVFEDIHEFDSISIRNLCFKYSNTFIGNKVKGRCYDFYNKYALKNLDD